MAPPNAISLEVPAAGIERGAAWRLCRRRSIPLTSFEKRQLLTSIAGACQAARYPISRTWASVDHGDNPGPGRRVAFDIDIEIYLADVEAGRDPIAAFVLWAFAFLM